MPAERSTGSGVLHALEEAEEALRAEQRTRHPLAGENARLRARRSRLQAERDRLLRTLAGLNEPSSPAAARLPEPLTPPFVLKPRLALGREVRGFLTAPLLVLGMLATQWHHPRAARSSLVLLLVVLLVQTGWFWLKRRRWLFTATGFFQKGLAEGRSWAQYAEVVSVGVSVSPHQRRHGIGTVVVTVQVFPPPAAPRTLLLKDVPEPERLAAWLRSRCPRTA